MQGETYRASFLEGLLPKRTFQVPKPLVDKTDSFEIGPSWNDCFPLRHRLLHTKLSLNKIHHEHGITRIVPVNVSDHLAADTEFVHFFLQGVAELRAMNAGAPLAVFDQIGQ